MSADRGPLSTNHKVLTYSFQHLVGKLTTAHTLGWKLGLKTGQYYLRSQSVDNKAKHLAIDMDTVKVENQLTVSLSVLVVHHNIKNR
jgi:hypothetical protein